MNNGPFDYVPAGMKAVETGGKWKLVPLEEKMEDDARIMLQEERVKTARLELLVKQLEAKIDKLQDENDILKLEQDIPANASKQTIPTAEVNPIPEGTPKPKREPKHPKE